MKKWSVEENRPYDWAEKLVYNTLHRKLKTKQSKGGLSIPMIYDIEI